MAASPTPPSTAHLALPFFDDAHRALARELLPWAAAQSVDERDDRAACRDWVRRLGAGRLAALLRAGRFGRRAASASIRARWCCCARRWPSTRRWPISRSRCRAWAAAPSRSPAARRSSATTCRAVARGDKIAAFALSEPDAGSDVGAMATQRRRRLRRLAARRREDLDQQRRHRRLLLRVRARPTPPPARAASRPSSSMPTRPGSTPRAHIEVMAPHPLATLRFEGCTVPREAQLGELHGGFKLAMRTLDIFRASVAGAALGMARRALAEAVAPCEPPAHVRPDAGRFPAHAGEARRDGGADRQRRAADLPRRLDARRQRGPRRASRRRPHRRGGDGQDVRHRERAAA